MIYIVGVGPGSEDYLTLKAVETVKNADIIAGSKRLLNLFDIKEGSKYVLTVNLKEELKELFDKKENYANIVILSSGDPCFSGLLKTVLNYIDKKDIEVISGISSIQIAASKIKISWEDYDILTLHGKEENRATLLNLIKNNKKVIFLPSDVKGDIKYLLENGVNPNKKIWICESLTYPNEKIIYDSLDNILNDKNNISYFSVCVVD